MAKVYKDALPPITGRAYQITDNGDGSKKITDVTRYEEEGTPFGASDVLESCTLVFEHTKSGSVHNFVNPNPTAKMGRAKMTANVEAGDTFQVNGTPVTAYMGVDAAVGAMAGSAYTGRWVSFIIEDGILNFKGGGGRVTVSGLSANAVKKGTTITVKQGAKTVQSVTGTYDPVAVQKWAYGHDLSTSNGTMYAKFKGTSNGGAFAASGNGIKLNEDGNYAVVFTAETEYSGGTRNLTLTITRPGESTITQKHSNAPYTDGHVTWYGPLKAGSVVTGTFVTTKSGSVNTIPACSLVVVKCKEGL